MRESDLQDCLLLEGTLLKLESARGPLFTQRTALPAT